MKPWLLLTVATLGCWGAWGLFANLASRHMNAMNLVIWEVAGAVIVAALAAPFVLRDAGPGLNVRGVTYALLTGMTYTVGLVFLFLALAAGRATEGPSSVHTILVVTAMYPVVASLLNLIVLHAPITPRQLLAMPLAVGALLLFTMDSA